VELLQSKGCEVLFGAPPGDVVSSEVVCIGPVGPVERCLVDVHWRLCSSPLFRHALLWDEVHAEARPLPALGPGARGLAAGHAFVNACVNRAAKLHFGLGDQLRLLYDVSLLAQRLDENQWRPVLDLAARRGCAGACHHGLVAAREVGPTAPAAVLEALDVLARLEKVRIERLRDWAYAQRAMFFALPTWRMRLRWLRQRLWPDAAFMRGRYGDAGGGTTRWFWQRLRDGWSRLR
jgi:hypothetical protein